MAASFSFSQNLIWRKAVFLNAIFISSMILNYCNRADCEFDVVDIKQLNIVYKRLSRKYI